MSVQMSQVLPLTKDKAAHSELQLAFLAKKTDSCIESRSGIGGRAHCKSSGEVTCVSVWRNLCVCVCVIIVCD